MRVKNERTYTPSYDAASSMNAYPATKQFYTGGVIIIPLSQQYFLSLVLSYMCHAWISQAF